MDKNSQPKRQLQLDFTEERKDLKSTFDVYKHPSKAQVIRIKNNDPEKYFCATFRTQVDSSKGMPHILEHSVLSGSKNFPLSDPFVALIKSSMPTFLNAYTYPDKTLYPVGSSNYQDFYNLTHVYLDTVFCPLLTKETFEREGWRYEFDENDKLQFQGVVYNEMKGVYSNVEQYVVEDGLLCEIYPDNAYKYVSGGDPIDIPKFTYQEFLDFYKKNYHPTNSLIIIYGMMTDHEEKKILNILSSYLDEYTAGNLQPIVVRSKPYKTRKTVKKTYQAEEGNKKIYTNLVYRLDDTFDSTIASIIVEYYLNDTRSCYKEIMETGFVERFVNINVESDLVQPYLAITIEVKSSNASEVIQEIFERHVKKSIEEGLDQEYLQGLVNGMEYAYLDSMDYNGFAIINELARRFAKDEELIKVDYQELLNQTKELLLDEKKLKAYLTKNFIKNNNVAIVEFLPDPNFNKNRTILETEELARIGKDLTKEEIKEIKEKSKIIKKGKKENEDCIPKLELKDLKKELNLKEIVITEQKGYNLLTIPTLEKKNNQLNIIFRLDKNFDKKYLYYLDLIFSKFFTFGTQDLTEDQLEIKTKQILGHYSSNISLKLDGEITGNISIGYLDSKAREAIFLLEEVIKSKNFDSRELLKNLIDSSLGQLQYTLKNESLEIITEKINIKTYKTKYYDSYSLANQVTALEELKKLIQDDYKQFLVNMYTSYREFIKNLSFSISYLSDNETPQEVIELGNNLHSFFNSQAFAPHKTKYQIKEFSDKLLEYQSSEIVNYHKQVIDLNGIDFTIGSMYLLARIATYEFGWPEVRSKGGAYGVRFGYLEAPNLLTTYTYRDPRQEENYNLMSDALRYISKIELNKKSLESLKIATINSYLPYMNPETEFAFYVSNYINDRNHNKHIQEVYDQIKNTTLEELKDLAEKILENKKLLRIISKKQK